MERSDEIARDAAVRKINRGALGPRMKKFLKVGADASADGTWHSVTVPVLTESEANHREVWYAVAEKARLQRGATMQAMKLTSADPKLVRSVHFIRYGIRTMDCDNLPGAIKRIRDQVAAWIAGDNTIKGKGDDSPTCGVAWTYAQVTGKERGVVIELRY